MLSDALDQLTLTTNRKGPMCTVGALRTVLDDDTWAKLERLIDEPLPDGTFVSCSQIADVLIGEGYRVQRPAIERHRRRSRGNGCACER